MRFNDFKILAAVGGGRLDDLERLVVDIGWPSSQTAPIFLARFLAWFCRNSARSSSIRTVSRFSRSRMAALITALSPARRAGDRPGFC